MCAVPFVADATRYAVMLAFSKVSSPLSDALQNSPIVAPDFTVSVRPGSPALVVVDEKVIPGEFFEPREPRLNRQALLGELKNGSSVPGAELSNPMPVLSVRTR